jgi:UDP-N-acetylglucosamine acyltransferase
MIHPTAIVQEGAEIHESVEIGPYCIVGPHVKIGAGTKVGPHAVLEGRTEIGENNQIFHHASVGAVPQHAKYRGEPTRLVIGSENIIREFVTIHLGTVEDRSVTVVGNRNLLMAYVHVAHDCTLEDEVILANAATLGGHVHVESNAILGGLVGVHQFVRIGRRAMIGGMAGVRLDIPPFTRASDNPAKLYGLNTIGLERAGFSTEEIGRLRKAYRILFQSGELLQDAIQKVRDELEKDPNVEDLLTFLETSERGFCR